MDLDWLTDLPAEIPPSLQITLDCGVADQVRMVVSGEVDAVAAVVLHKAVVDALRHHRPRCIELDVAGVTFLDAGGTSALVLCQADARQVDCRIRLVHPQPAVYRVLKMTGLLEHFSVIQPIRS